MNWQNYILLKNFHSQKVLLWVTIYVELCTKKTSQALMNIWQTSWTPTEAQTLLAVRPLSLAYIIMCLVHFLSLQFRRKGRQNKTWRGIMQLNVCRRENKEMLKLHVIWIMLKHPIKLMNGGPLFYIHLCSTVCTHSQTDLTLMLIPSKEWQGLSNTVL